MIDTRCYKCVRNDKIKSFVEENYHPDYSHKEYQGKGFFKCPRCKDITDLSRKTYTTKISRTYDEDGTLVSDLLEFDSKLNNEGRDTFKQDMLELDVFEDIPWGKYVLDILWYYYESAGLDGPEWNVEIEILSKKEIIE